MSNVVLWMSVSLDGFFEGPERELDWHRVDEELHQHFNDALRPMAAFLGGRRTYELMAAYWPTADAEPGATPVEVEFAGIWREKPKVVYSRTLTSAAWGTTVVPEVVPDQVRALKAASSGDLCLGGADVAATFMREDLIDEYRIYVHPVILGAGHPLFTPDTPHQDLRLIESRTFTNGVVLLRYERARDRRARD